MKLLLHLLLVLFFAVTSSLVFAQSELLTAKELRKKKEYRSLAEALSEPEKVYRLRLKGDAAIEFPEEIEEFVNLQSLTFGSKEAMEHFTQIPNSLTRVYKLQSLKLHGIANLDLIQTFHLLAKMENLEKLSLLGLGDELEVLPSEIEKLENLISLGLSGSKTLKYLPKSIQKLKNLEVFYWENIPNLDIANTFKKFRNLNNLKRLSCFGNQITEIPTEIEYLKNLEKLDLSFNDLTTVPEELGKLKRLKSIDLFSNKRMDTLPKTIGKLKQLENLNLGNNQIKELPRQIIKLENLKELYLSGNPIPEKEQGKIKKLLPNTEILF